MTSEIWKPIPNYIGYEASNFGNIRSFRNPNGKLDSIPHLIKPRPGKDGYLEVHIADKIGGIQKRIPVHRLIALTFYPDHPDNYVVNHINGNNIDNRSENLEWVSPKLNSTMAKMMDLYNTAPVEIVELNERFNSLVECAKYLKCHPTSISHALSEGITIKGYHVRRLEEKHDIDFLKDYQKKAVDQMFNGCILNGGVGSGKSRTSLYYYYKVCGGKGNPKRDRMTNPLDLYIITTAKKRDSLEWESEFPYYLISNDPSCTPYRNKIAVDSWNNIHKYEEVHDAFFIFDEQRLVGTGAWTKSFQKIVKKNQWILLTATSGDQWTDYAQVFIANGYFRNITEFRNNHVVYNHHVDFPQIDRYVNEGRLIRLRNHLLIPMDFERETVRHNEDIYVSYDAVAYHDIWKNRWNYEKNEPMKSASEVCFAVRKLVNSDISRQIAVLELFEDHPRMIIFYSYDYELDILKGLFENVESCDTAEWNGHKHQPIPESSSWVYLVQYTAGCEGWNCIKTDTIVFYSQTYSYKVLEQARGRIDRLNTPFRDLYYYHLKSRAGIDLAISQALAKKKTFNEGQFFERRTKNAL